MLHSILPPPRRVSSGETTSSAAGSGDAKSSEATGQSVQSKLHTVGEHRPGGPTTAELDDSDVSLASRYRALRLGPEQYDSGPVAKMELHWSLQEESCA